MLVKWSGWVLAAAISGIIGNSAYDHLLKPMIDRTSVRTTQASGYYVLESYNPGYYEIDSYNPGRRKSK